MAAQLTMCPFATLLSAWSEQKMAGATTLEEQFTDVLTRLGFDERLRKAMRMHGVTTLKKLLTLSNTDGVAERIVQGHLRY